MSNRIYIGIASIAFISFAVLIFLSPELKEEKQKKASLWENKAWELIEYQTGTSEIATLRFLRKANLSSDKYYIENLDNIELKNPKKYIRRSASHSVKNIFSDWYNPSIVSYYELNNIENNKKETLQKELSNKKTHSKTEKQKMTLESLGLEKPNATLKFYEKINARPRIITIGKIIQDKNVFIQMKDSASEPNLVFLLPKHLIKHFKKAISSYRANEVINIPRKSYIKSIEIEIEKQGSYIFKQKETEKGDASAKKYQSWFYNQENLSNIEIPSHIFSPFLNNIKALRIDRFYDAEDMKKYPKSQELWDTAGSDFMRLVLKIDNGKTYSISLRRPKIKILTDANKNKTEYFLIKNSIEADFIDFIKKSKLDEIINNWLKVQKLLI